MEALCCCQTDAFFSHYLALSAGQLFMIRSREPSAKSARQTWRVDSSFNWMMEPSCWSDLQLQKSQSYSTRVTETSNPFLPVSVSRPRTGCGRFEDLSAAIRLIR